MIIGQIDELFTNTTSHSVKARVCDLNHPCNGGLGEFCHTHRGRRAMPLATSAQVSPGYSFRGRKSPPPRADPKVSLVLLTFGRCKFGQGHLRRHHFLTRLRWVARRLCELKKGAPQIRGVAYDDAGLAQVLLLLSPVHGEVL